MASGLSGDAAEAPPAGREPPGRTPEAGEASGTDHALRALEFGRVLELVAGRSVSDLGADHVRSLRPHGDPEEAREALATADEMTAFLMRDEAWVPPEVPDVRESLQRLRTPDSVLEADQVRRLGLLLQSSRRCRTVVLRWSSEFRRLASVADPLVKAPELAERILESVDDGGGVTDAASPALRRTRRDLRQARNRLVERLEDLAAGLPERIRVPDASVTVRGGRYCIPVRREGRSEVGGLVHDESASQQTLFVEPPLAIEPMNRIRELELQERREIRRVLEELTGELRPLAGEMEASLRALVRLDSLHARARYALDHGGHPPELGTEGGGVRIADGVHPLLEASEEPSVPFDLALEPEEGVLLVSGPNAGGKTVLLKSVGLMSAMAQSGIVPPAGPRTRLPVFSRFFAVIGDEQSIEASLSTFSAQVENLKEILEESDGSSLVLVDEIGGNTDPGEGSALAAAVLLQLAEQAGLTVATTHLGALKTLAEEDDRIVNASLQFDREALRPTYRLVRDRPGRSWALEIAERMGLPGPVLEEARSRLPEEERAVESLLAELEERQAEAERLASELRRREGEVERREEEFEARVAELDARERELEREAREREERYLLEARERVEEAIERLRDRVRDAPPAERGTEDVAADGEEALTEAASEARAEVEEAVREARRRTPERSEVREEGAAPELEEGDAVRIRSLDRRGRVREVREEDVVVAAGDVRLTLPAGDLELVEDDDAPGGDGPPDGSSRPGGGGTRPRIDARPEVDLRGRRVHEVDRPLLTALDEAVVSGLPRLRIIHGKGTGALRSRVQELLESDGRVRTFRAGEPGEGGFGVTVAELGDGEETT